MKFLKVLINALLTGFFFSALLALLIYDLNINQAFSVPFVGQLSLFLFLTYGVLITAISMLVFFVIQFFTGRNINISILSPSFLTVSFSFVLFFYLLIFKANFDYFRSFFSSQITALLQKQSAALFFLGLLGISLFYVYLRYKKNSVFLIVFFVCLLAGIVFIALQRANYPPLHSSDNLANLEIKRIDRKITIIGMEGLSFDFMIPLINEEKMPNFAWLIEEGSWGRLENFTPTEPLLLSSSFNTGKLPPKHRQLSLFKYSFLNSSREMDVVPRFIFFGQLLRTGLLLRSPHQSPSFTKDLWNIFEETDTAFIVRDWPYSFKVQSPSPKAEQRFNLIFKDLQSNTHSLFENVKQAFYRDFEFEDLIMRQKTKTQPQLVYFMVNGLNTVESYFYKYSFPDLFGDLDQEQISMYGSVIEKYYQFYDDIVGKYLASLKEDDLLIVYSPHGIEPLPLWKRFVEWILGNSEISAYHELAPDGVVFFYGKDIVRGKNIERMRIIDIAPTILNYLGLPVGKDMDGIVSSSIFVEEFKFDNPVLFISSYEETAIKQPQRP